MKFQIAPLTPDDLGALARFLEQTWSRPHDKEFLTWRFLHSQPYHSTLLAWSQGECIGVLCAFRRTGVLDGKRFPLLSIIDWFCRPDMRGQGIGGALLRTLMSDPTPILGFGGTADTRTRLPKMGWRVLAEAVEYVLPLDGSLLARGAARKLGLPLSLLRVPSQVGCRLWFRGGLAARAARADVEIVSIPDDRVQEPYECLSRQDLVVLPEPPLIQWMRAGPKELGKYEAIGHICEGRLQDWMLIRRYSVSGEARAALVDLSPLTGDARRRSLIAPAVALLAASGVQRIDAITTTPDLQRDLRRNRFLRRATFPVFWWSSGAEFPRGSVHLTANCADDAYL